MPPNETIYINNLNEKVKKDELKKSLYAVFSQFGKILDVICAKTLKLRGQAWVVFSDVASASNAVRQMQGFPFYDKPMRITYARTKSHVITKADGTFQFVDKKKRDAEKAKKRHQDAATAAAQENGAAPMETGGAFGAAPAAPAGGVPMAPGPAAAPPRPIIPEAPAPPNKLLFIQGLPLATTSTMLQMLFQQFPGFKEVRMIEARPGIAFVEFDDESQATVAMSGLQGFKIAPENPMILTYAKKA